MSGRGPTTRGRLDRVRLVADAVLYEGYLLYPYRSTSAKNQVRWQFGVLGPSGAADRGVGEPPDLAVQCLVQPYPPSPRDHALVASAEGSKPMLTVHLRFLQLQERTVEQADPTGGFVPVNSLRDGDQTWLSWEEAVEREIVLGPFELGDGEAIDEHVDVAEGRDIELLHRDDQLIGRVVRRRHPIRARLRLLSTSPQKGLLRTNVAVTNVTATEGEPTRRSATAHSLLGAHLIMEIDGGAFISVIDPPPWAAGAAAACTQHRCWPVLAGPEGSTDVVLCSPIILYDHPAVAPESAGSLFDATEIDEILTLRVMTMTDDEKAEARATDPHAAAIIDRCDALSPSDLQQMHGTLRDPHASIDPPADRGGPAAAGQETPWWDPAADASVDPATDIVLVQGVPVGRGSRVRLHPSRRADAQDLFFADQEARVTAVLGDVDGDTHVAVVLVDDPAADLHEWYGRYLYFAPEELEPLDDNEEGNRS
jgi:hypothetical protein